MGLIFKTSWKNLKNLKKLDLFLIFFDLFYPKIKRFDYFKTKGVYPPFWFLKNSHESVQPLVSYLQKFYDPPYPCYGLKSSGRSQPDHAEHEAISFIGLLS